MDTLRWTGTDPVLEQRGGQHERTNEEIEQRNEFKECNETKELVQHGGQKDSTEVKAHCLACGLRS